MGDRILEEQVRWSYAALHDFLAEKFPLLNEEWLARRASLRDAPSRAT